MRDIYQRISMEQLAAAAGVSLEMAHTVLPGAGVRRLTDAALVALVDELTALDVDFERAVDIAHLASAYWRPVQLGSQAHLLHTLRDVTRPGAGNTRNRLNLPLPVAAYVVGPREKPFGDAPVLLLDLYNTLNTVLIRYANLDIKEVT